MYMHLCRKVDNFRVSARAGFGRRAQEPERAVRGCLLLWTCVPAWRPAANQERKKPIWRNTRRNSTTSAYSLLSPPALPVCSLSSHPIISEEAGPLCRASSNPVIVCRGAGQASARDSISSNFFLIQKRGNARTRNQVRDFEAAVGPLRR